MPNFEWTPGIPIEDEIIDETEQVLTIADYETVESPPVEDSVDIEVNEDAINEDGLEIQEEVAEPDVEDTPINVPEDNIVNKEEEFVKSEDDDLRNEEMPDSAENENDEVFVADIKNNPEPTHTISTRPRRANAG